MSQFLMRWTCLGCLGCCAAGLVSCSSESGTAAADASAVTQVAPQAAPSPAAAPAERPPAPFVPPAVSIGERIDDADDADLADAPAVPEPAKGTPEWLIREITRLTTAPMDRVRQTVPGAPGEAVDVQLTTEQAAQEKLRRAHEIVDLALEVCIKTKGDAARQQLFNNGVHYLAEARTTLALAGDHEQASLLADEAETLYRLDAKSFAAMESNLKLVQLLQQLAEREGAEHPDWGSAAARQARLFAGRFPQEAARGALALLSAAQACESAGQFEEARQCFVTFDVDFGQTPFADHAVGSLRRYRLVGQPLTEFAGATIDGAQLSIEQFRGRTVLVVFWSAASERFGKDLPRLKAAIEAFGDRPLTVMGVNFDQDESIVDSYLVQADLPWRTLFSPDPEQRGLQNPIAKFYGVATLPQYWVVNATGVVVAAPTDLQGAEAALKRLSAP